MLLGKRRLGALVVALCMVVAAGCRREASPDASEAEVPALVDPVGVRHDFVEVLRQDVSNYKMVEAVVRPGITALSFPIDGTVPHAEVAPLARVKAGDVLATLYGEDQAETEAQLEASLARAEEEAATQQTLLALDLADAKGRESELEAAGARVSTDRGDIAVEDALKLNAIEQQRIERQIERAKRDDAVRIEALEDELVAYQEKVREGTLVAPFDGRVLRIVNQGREAQVQADEPYLELVDETSLYIESEYLSESELEIALSMEVEIRGQRYPLTPREVDWTELIDRSIAGLELSTYYDFEEGQPEAVRAGDGGQVYLETRRIEQALTVPINALYQSGGDTYVYRRVGETDQREKVEVKIELKTATVAVIQEGLTEGDVVYVKDS